MEELKVMFTRYMHQKEKSNSKHKERSNKRRDYHNYH